MWMRLDTYHPPKHHCRSKNSVLIAPSTPWWQCSLPPWKLLRNGPKKVKEGVDLASKIPWSQSDRASVRRPIHGDSTLGQTLALSCGFWPRAMAADSLSSAGCEVGPPWVGLAYQDWELGNLEARSTPPALCHILWEIPEQFFMVWQGALSGWGTTTVIAEHHCHGGCTVYCDGVWVGGLCQVGSAWMPGPTFPSRALHCKEMISVVQLICQWF